MFGISIVSQGVLGKMRGKTEIGRNELRDHVETGELTVLVPIDPGINPWSVPRLFSLSRKQALELLDAVEDDGRIEYVLRSDRTIALMRRRNADPNDDGVLDRGTEPLPGDAHHPG